MSHWLARGLCRLGLHRFEWGGALPVLGLSRNLYRCARWHNHGVPCGHMTIDSQPYMEREIAREEKHG